MRQGMSPEQALMKVMERVIGTTEKRLLDGNGRPYFDLQYYALNKKGEYACSTLYQGDPARPAKFAVCDAKGPRVENCAYMWKLQQPSKTRPDSAYARP